MPEHEGWSLAMREFQAVYYRDRHGVEPVRVFLDALDAAARATVRNQVNRPNMLSDELPHLPFPHSSQIEGELRELRCHNERDLYRVLYQRSDRLIILLHVLEKRSAKVSRRDIRLAQERWNDFKTRMDASSRMPPRAAGRDAP